MIYYCSQSSTTTGLPNGTTRLGPTLNTLSTRSSTRKLPWSFGVSTASQQIPRHLTSKSLLLSTSLIFCSGPTWEMATGTSIAMPCTNTKCKDNVTKAQNNKAKNASRVEAGEIPHKVRKNAKRLRDDVNDHNKPVKRSRNPR